MEQFHLEILLEEIRGKFDLVLDGHAALRAEILEYRRESNEKHDLTAFKLEVLNETLNNKIDGAAAALRFELREFRGEITAKIDALAADLAAHRADTEAHPRYLVRE
jgi:hypothetical protein